jgi:lipopolysaccharide export LptBFGC system permease protein LptF
VLSGALYFLSSEVSPTLNYRKKAYTKSSLTQALRTLSPGRTELKYGDFYLSARERDTDDRNRFRQVFLHMPADDERPAQTLYAQSVEVAIEGAVVWVDLTWPRWADEERDTRVGNLRLRVDLAKAIPTEAEEQVSWRYQRSPELRRRIARTDAVLAQPADPNFAFVESEGYIEPRKLRWARFELHSREALAGICPMFLLLGVPTGLMLRRGSQLGALAASILYALLYYLLSMRFGKLLAGGESVPAWVAAWGTTFFGSAVGMVLTWRAIRR